MTPSGAATPTETEAAIAFLRDNLDARVAELVDFVRIASVSAQPNHAHDVRRAADWLADRLRVAGLENVDFVDTGLHPAVVADWLHAGPDAPTLLFYGHYDVQPASLADGWDHDPFDAQVRDGRVWGRGTTDDKGQMMCHVLGVEAWLAACGRLPVNVKMVFEGEEEIGSRNFGKVLDQAADRLRADLLIVSDNPMPGEDQPAITLSLRGLAKIQVHVQGPNADLHSGAYGGVVRNPLEALAHMLASLKDPATGRVLVAGFYDDVAAPSPERRARMAGLGETDEAYQRTLDVDAAFGEEGWSNLERIGVRPTLDVNGMWGGYQGEGSKTIIPASAHAKISCRLVANQDEHRIAELLETHLRAAAPTGVRVSVQSLGHGGVVSADPDHPLLGAVRRALAATWGVEPLELPSGVTIPAVADMQRRLGAVPALVGFGHRDENMHGPQESFRLANLERGSQACARLIAEVAHAHGRPSLPPQAP